MNFSTDALLILFRHKTKFKYPLFTVIYAITQEVLITYYFLIKITGNELLIPRWRLAEKNALFRQVQRALS